MPTYLLHGFRWPRPLIRIHIILQNLEDAAANWLVAPATTQALLENFQEIYPECMKHLPNLRFVEQYDPSDVSDTATSQPYAYVADVCEEITLGVDIDEVRGKGVPNEQWAMIMELRDKLAADQKVAWYVVVCGDEDRWAPGISDSSTSKEAESSAGPVSLEESDTEKSSEQSFAPAKEEHTPVKDGPTLEELYHQQSQQPRGIKKLFSAIGRRKSRTNLKSSKSSESVPNTVREAAPALPTARIADARSIVSEDSLKFSIARSHTSNSSSDKALVSPIDDKGRRPSPSNAEQIARMSSAHSLVARSSNRTLNNGPLVQSASALSLIEDEDHEVITGPTEEDDDDLAAPAPTVKQGKQQDQISKQRKRTSIPSFAAARRGTSPDTLRNIRTQQSFGDHDAISQTASHEQGPHQILNEFLRDSVTLPPGRPKQNSPPASYIPTGAPITNHGSVRTSRSSSPVKNAAKRQSNSRLSALAALEGNAPSAYTASTPRRGRGGASRSRRSSVQNLNQRHSQYSMSSMSGAMASLYGNHEREFNRHRQSVTQDELVARGLDNMDFGALR